jgi:hypothetical protein
MKAALSSDRLEIEHTAPWTNLSSGRHATPAEEPLLL